MIEEMKKTSKILIASVSGVAVVFVGFLALLPGGFNWILPFKRCETKFKQGEIYNECDGTYNPPYLFTYLINLPTIATAKFEANTTTPQLGGSCGSMQDYFNSNFGRDDTRFSNYEGQIANAILGELYCDGGVIIQTLPTGKKTCSAHILYNSQTKGMRWYTEDKVADCFISQ